jgi:hypothetical protein
MPDVEHSLKQDAPIAEHSKIQAITLILVERKGLYDPSLTITAMSLTIAWITNKGSLGKNQFAKGQLSSNCAMKS